MSDHELEARIASALEIAELAEYDGEHHKAYVIDQIVRQLTGCPEITKTGVGSLSGTAYEYQALGESDEYRTFRADKPWWDEGVAP